MSVIAIVVCGNANLFEGIIYGAICDEKSLVWKQNCLEDQWIPAKWSLLFVIRIAALRNIIFKISFFRYFPSNEMN